MSFENVLEKISKKFEIAEKARIRRAVNMAMSDAQVRLALNNDRMDASIYFGEIEIVIKDKILSRKLTEGEWVEILFKEKEYSDKVSELVGTKPIVKSEKLNSPTGKLRELYELLNNKGERGNDFFGDVHKVLSPMLRHFLLKWLKLITPDKADRLSFFIEDALQEVFFKFHQKSDEILGKYDKPAAWFFKVSKTSLINHLRTQSKIERHEKCEELAHLSLENDICGGDDPSDKFVAEDLNLFLKKKILQIKSKLLRESAMTIHQVGDNFKASSILGLSEDAFKARKMRVRQALQKSLSKSEVFDKKLLLLPKERWKLNANSKLNGRE